MTDQIANRLREVLLSAWDPLDVGSNDKLHDEYDEVLDEIISSTIDSSSAERVFSILLRAEHDYEISPIDTSRLRRVADQIVEAAR